MGNAQTFFIKGKKLKAHSFKKQKKLQHAASEKAKNG